jgi:hypothetical protein
MPWLPPHQCSWPDCRGLQENTQRFCIEHRKLVYRKEDRKPATHAERAFAADWQNFSTAYLSRPENKLCINCGKREATDVYYSTEAPFAHQQPVTLREENCSAVCSACRKAKEHRLD